MKTTSGRRFSLKLNNCLLLKLCTGPTQSHRLEMALGRLRPRSAHGRLQAKPKRLFFVILEVLYRDDGSPRFRRQTVRVEVRTRATVKISEFFFVTWAEPVTLILEKNCNVIMLLNLKGSLLVFVFEHMAEALSDAFV